MPSMITEQRQSQQIRQELKQVFLIEQAKLLEMPEQTFIQLVIELEKTPLFVRLYQEEKLIHYQRVPKTDISSQYFQLREETTADKGSLDVESLLENKARIVRLVEKLGLEKFKRYFLFPESGMVLEEIAEECGLSISEVREINDLVNDFSILSEFYHPSAFSSEQIRYSKIASVERRGDSFTIGYLSAPFARGRYRIDYGSFEELRVRGVFTETEVSEAKQLFKRLESVNSCKDTVSQILQGIVDKQALYLECGDPKSLLPFSQKELAEKIGLAPSSVSRAINRKSLETPLGTEVPLKHFFPRSKKFKKELIKQLLETEEGLSSDDAIKTELQEKFGVTISRRSVADLRKELRLPASRCKSKYVRYESEGD
ncbi:MAG: hypothetical protein JSV77_03060 [Dehalococcoidales bacterium]|nr:MAG: hypothetical protein JSV77_03060 [Dehalococcoidales bacterium]